jgi:hypothetical protein
MIALVQAAHHDDHARYIVHQAGTCYAASLSSPTIGLQPWLKDYWRRGDEMMRHIGSQCRPIAEAVISLAASRTVDANFRMSRHDQPCLLTPPRKPYSSACPRWHNPFFGRHTSHPRNGMPARRRPRRCVRFVAPQSHLCRNIGTSRKISQITSSDQAGREGGSVT